MRTMGLSSFSSVASSIFSRHKLVTRIVEAYEKFEEKTKSLKNTDKPSLQ